MTEYNNNLELENGLLDIVNIYLEDIDINLSSDDYYRVNINLWDRDRIKKIIKTFEFKRVGSGLDFKGIIPQDYSINDTNAGIAFEDIDIVSVSEKYNAIMIHTLEQYRIRLFIMIDKSNIEKFNKKFAKIMQLTRSSGIFDSVDFKCKKKEYIEISEPLTEEDKFISIQKKKLPKENLVFDTSSEIFNVMNDIKLFFDKDTKKLYEKMGILYKRGIILHGDPGNGKTAMIREIIRQLENVTSIIINPNTPRVTFYLSELINALKNKPAIIVIEDIDAVINNNNRSELLNILDGVNMRSGVFFIGTTNYPERIDPAFVNRSGRFDRSYEIPNPGELTRKAFFRSCKLGDILSGYKIHKDNSENTSLNTIDLFVKYSDDLSMANLKELMISTQYMLIQNKNISIEEALEKNYNTLIKNKTDHDNSYDEYNNYNDVKPRYVPYSVRRHRY